jgi:Homeodomain-like domain
MARAVPVPVRQVLLQRWRRGQTVAEIADALALPRRTVRRLIQRFSQARSTQTLAPAYERCGWQRPWPNPEVFRAALDLRRQHPHWGALLIRVILQERWPRQPLPSARTLQRWFAGANLAPAPRGRQPQTHTRRASQAHAVWQMDAVERLQLRPGCPAVSWLRISDEFSGAILYTKVFAVGVWSQVGEVAVQAELRQAFARWGLPQGLRVDNGHPWGSKGDLPTQLALWILGLGVALTWNPPRQPRKNAVVERTQGVSEQWAEPWTCASAAELQARLDHLDRIQREQYPSLAGSSRTQCYPELAHSGRRYTPQWEAGHWNLDPVMRCLAEYAVPRRVDKNGEVSIYGRGHWVGKPWQEQLIYVSVDARTREWLYLGEDGGVIRRQAATDLSAERITGLRVARVRHRAPRDQTRRPH